MLTSKNLPQIVQAIVTASDELVRRFITWLQDPHGGPVVPPNVSTQLKTVDIMFTEAGVENLPLPCQELFLKTRRLVEEHRAWADREHGKVRTENGAPGPSFWAAVKQFAIARNGAEQPLVEVLEPVSLLLKQGVSHMQIGMHIYGRGGVGPFIQSNGDVNTALIEKEGASPGSVIPPDWVPPWHAQAAERRLNELNAKLEIFGKMEVAQKYDDPCTVEEMLRDGCYVQQIERGKGVTREEVLESAKRIGITPVDGPGYQPQFRDSPQVAGVDPAPEETAAKKSRYVSPELKALIIEAHEKDPSKGAPEIAADLTAAGHNVFWRVVSATLSHHKKKKIEHEAAGEVATV